MIRDLTPGDRVIPTMAGVDQIGAVVLVIDITAGHDNRVRTFGCSSADARLQRAMNKGLMELSTINEELTRAHSVRGAKEPRHAQTPFASRSPHALGALSTHYSEMRPRERDTGAIPSDEIFACGHIRISPDECPYSRKIRGGPIQLG